MRTLAIGAFLLDGAASVGFLAILALGTGRMTPLDGFILCALILGFVSALGSVVHLEPLSSSSYEAALVLSGAAMFDRLPDATKRDVRQHFQVPAMANRPQGDPARHLALLSQPYLGVSLTPSRVQ